jgi:hypothetical protein
MTRIKASGEEHERSSAKTKTGTQADCRKAGTGTNFAALAKLRACTRFAPRGEGRWMRFAGLVETGDPRSSRSIDDIVYSKGPAR